jgi:shikimate kinase
VLIFLIGFMGSGKSTAGRILAARLGYEFADLDTLIEEQEKMPITEIFALRGEEYFRMAESRALNTLLDRTGMVVACGGGTPCFHDNMQRMKSAGLTIYLKASTQVLTRRLSGKVSKRPLVAGLKGDELRSHLQKLLSGREGWYRQSHIIFPADQLDMDALLEITTSYIESH